MNGESESPAALGAKHLKQLILPLAIVLAGVVVFRMGRDPDPLDPAPGLPAPAAERVVVEAAQPDQEPVAVETAWRPGITVREATDAAFPAEWRGDGEMAFLESLLDTPNQGADGLNWQFEVNGEYAERGAGAVRLEARDRVLWKLAPYE